jgi:two-component sensor histidine kinase
VFWGIRYWQLAAAGAFYLFFATLYFVTLELNTGQPFPAYVLQVSVNYTARVLPSLAVWWLLFVRLRAWPMWWRLPLHLVLCPLWVAVQVNLYHWGCDLVGEGYMTGSGFVWDLYIPALFYLIQFAVYHVYDYNLQLQKSRERSAQLERLALQSELAALKAQLNPHFLFNTLNSINASLPPHLESVREQIARLSDMFRYPLSVVERELVPLQEELDFVENYLLLEQQRFSERLRFRLDVEDAVRGRLIPPLLIQPLVENAVKHGISRPLAGGEINVQARQGAEGVEVTVSDNGQGLNQPPGDWLFGKGLGLKNTRLRLEKMFGRPLEVTVPVGGGFQVAFTIPQTD